MRLAGGQAVGALGTAGSAVLGGPVAAYTAALISNTAVPAWHDGHRWMPFVFVSSGLSAASGWGLLAAPATDTAPLVPLAVGGGLAEEARAAEILTVGGSLLAAVSRGNRARAAAAGAALLAGSALTRFGVFHAGLISAEDPKYTVVPQRERLDNRDGAS